MCPRASRWTRRPSVSSSVRMSSAYSTVPATSGARHQPGRVDLGREVPGIGQDHPVPQQAQVSRGDHVTGAGDGDDEVGLGDGGIARRRAEPVQVRLEPGHRVDVDHGDPRVAAAEVGCHPAPARPVAEDGDLLAVGRAVGHPQVGLKRALPDGVVVLRELLDRAVVDDQDRPPELAAQRFQPHPARGRLLGPADQPVVGTLKVPGEQVAAVVQDQVRLGRQDLAQVPVVLPGVLGGLADHGDALGAQQAHRVRLGRVEVPGRDDPGAAVAQGQDQRRRLGLQVDAGTDRQASERPRPRELRRDVTQQPAVLPHPVDAR